MEDRISALPDEVLSDILSLLPTEDVVSSMILSKRWLKLWRYVPVLDLNCEYDYTDVERRSRFVKLVYVIILSRIIKRFHLKSASISFYSDLKIWIEDAVNNGVEDLHLDLPHPTNFSCSSVFSCRTLVHLKLAGLRVNIFNVPDLPLLKTLHFSHTDFDDPRDLADILNACPILEDLFLYFIEYKFSPREPEVKSLHKLIKATIFHISSFYYPHVEAFANVEYLELIAVSLPTCAFPNLKHLTIEYDKNWNQVLQMLEHSPMLQTLEIQLPDIKISAYDDEPGGYCFVNKDMRFPRDVPVCLSSQLRECTLIRYKGVECELQFAKYILQNSKILQTMRIQTSSYTSAEERSEMRKELSTCPRSSATCDLA